MQHYSVKPLQATLLPSRRLAALLIAMHLLAALPLLLVPLATALRLALSLALLCSLFYYIYRHGLQKLGDANDIDGLHLAADGTFSVRMRQGEWQAAEVRGSSFVQPWLTVLHLRLVGRRGDLALVLLPDMLPREDFRRLRVWLRWGRKPTDMA